MSKCKYITKDNVMYGALLISLAAVLGSLYFSEVLKLPPCTLCWYQRVFIYPLPLILTAGILNKDYKVYNYVFPLTILGLLLSIYHVLLQLERRNYKSIDMSGK